MLLLHSGTHNVQNITVNSMIGSGTVEVNVHFLRNSLAKGCLLILSHTQYTRYFTIKKDSNREIESKYIESLPQGDYVIRGYDIERSGLPSHPTPAITYSFILRRGSEFWNQGTEN